jgi:hypothetical protein
VLGPDTLGATRQPLKINLCLVGRPSAALSPPSAREQLFISIHAGATGLREFKLRRDPVTCLEAVVATRRPLGVNLCLGRRPSASLSSHFAREHLFISIDACSKFEDGYQLEYDPMTGPDAVGATRASLGVNLCLGARPSPAPLADTARRQLFTRIQDGAEFDHCF